MAYVLRDAVIAPCPAGDLAQRVSLRQRRRSPPSCAHVALVARTELLGAAFPLPLLWTTATIAHLSCHTLARQGRQICFSTGISCSTDVEPSVAQGPRPVDPTRDQRIHHHAVQHLLLVPLAVVLLVPLVLL